MRVVQSFEQIVDSDDEAHAFGLQSAELAFKYVEGFQEYDDES